MQRLAVLLQRCVNAALTLYWRCIGAALSQLSPQMLPDCMDMAFNMLLHCEMFSIFPHLVVLVHVPGYTGIEEGSGSLAPRDGPSTYVTAIFER